MEDINKRVFSEVVEILKCTEKEIIEKIPKELIDFFVNNVDITYKPNIDFNDADWIETIDDDTQAILGLLYRDYIVSNEEKIKLLREEQEEIIKVEGKLSNLNDMFSHKTYQDDKKENNLAEIKKQSWYSKIINKIFRLFITKKHLKS